MSGLHLQQGMKPAIRFNKTGSVGPKPVLHVIPFVFLHNFQINMPSPVSEVKSKA
jgi:hypothetical protein